MIVEIIVFLVSGLLAYFVYMHKKAHQFFDEKGVKYLPGVPIFGNAMRSTLHRSHMLDDLAKVHHAFPSSERYVGYIEGTVPILMIRDPELIKAITVKDFEHFVDHKMFFPEEIEPLLGASLIQMKGEKWYEMRTRLSPGFTGSKMRKILPFMMEISSRTITYLKGHVNEDIDVEDLMHRYACDVIASAGFGLQIDSLKDKDNQFYMSGHKMFKFNALERFMFFFMAIFPKLSKKLGFSFFDTKINDFFNNLVASTMEHREKNNIERPDMIQLLMEAAKGSSKAENDDSDNFAPTDDTFKPKSVPRQWTQIDLASQVFIYYVAGSESTANAMGMCVHELALSPDVQEKLYQEVKQFKEEQGELTYDNMSMLKYLDCVLNETQRKWAAALIMDRTCTKPYELPPPREGGKPVQVNTGDIVYNLVNTIHMDPQHYPDPHKFDPERFNDENKHKIKPFTYVPFGMGPRNCIGLRFAVMEMKVFIFELVLNFKIIKTAKTSDPIELAPDAFNVQPKNGSWVKLEPRT